MKALNIIFIVLILLSVVGAIAVIGSDRKGDEEIVGCTMDALICGDGTVVGRTGPDCSFADCPTETPTSPVPTPNTPAETGDDVDAHIASKADRIVVQSPTRGETIGSPVSITGKARGSWFFEATFPITIVDWDGRILADGYATAEDEWMTESFVPFKATISFTVPPDTAYDRGSIILQKANASGLPEHDDALEIPVVFE